MEGAPLRRAFFCFERLPRTRLFHLDISLSASTTRIGSPLHGQRFGRGLVGHTAELAGARIDIVTLREDAANFGPALKEAGRAVVKEWLSGTAL